MKPANLSFVNPDRRREVCFSLGCLALSTGALFTRREAAKIFGVTVLSTYTIFIMNPIFHTYYYPPDYSDKKHNTCAVRSDNRFVHVGGENLRKKMFAVALFAGVTISLASRASFSSLKNKAGLKQVAPAVISSLTLSLIAGDYKARQLPAGTKEVPHFKTRMKYFKGCAFAALVLMNIGIIAYRSGLFSKAP